MKDAGGRWQNRIWATMGAGFRRPRASALATRASGAATHAAPKGGVAMLKAKIGTAAFAFRGYDVNNLGRSLELLEHPAYGPVVRGVLREASDISAEALGHAVDLAGYIREGRPTSLEDFPLDVAMIVAMEMAQVRLLEVFFDVPVREARLSFGYSIGELAAMVLGGMFRLDQLLPVPLGLAADCAELAADTSLGVLFTRGPLLPPADVERLCVAISSEGHGLIGPSAYLSPNTALILGQGDTLDRLERSMKDYLPGKVMLRRNPNRWPPLHSPLVWQRNIPNRTAMAVYKIDGVAEAPVPPVISCVTGKASYDSVNCRDTLVQWTDRPQRLWDAIDGTLSAGAEVVIHVGPAPNLIPATFNRLSNNIEKQLGNKYLRGLGRGVVSSMNRHAWLAHLLPHRAALLRAPFLEHVILEDWLLEQEVA
jgi:[acyl-carrier-protein] S-malonyltransferase